nr:MAG TPA: hypothetical protein [Caudoviricetes sp.]
MTLMIQLQNTFKIRIPKISAFLLSLTLHRLKEKNSYFL